MKRLLIANRGEIAVRIARTAGELGLGTVAVHTPEDAELARGYGTDERVALDGRGAAAYTPGFMVGPEVEARAQVRKASRLFVAGATLSVPLVTVVLRKGYGLGAQAMAGGSFAAPVMTVSWPTGEIGAMGLEGAVRLGFKKQLEAVDGDERQALFDEMVGRMVDKGQALNAASQLELDAVIDPVETRRYVLRALDAAGPVEGSRRVVDTW